MYHGRFKGTHYEAGYKYGKFLADHGHIIKESPTFEITAELKEFSQKCLPLYRKYYPEVVEEIQGMADGQNSPLEYLTDILFPMYCFKPQNHCTAFALSDGKNILLGKNSDFLVSIEKLYQNCLYNLTDSYAFNGNTTAFIQIEDGMNQQGLAVALTFLYPHLNKPGLNAGMLVRYLLEKCTTVDEALAALKELPIASAQMITLADSIGKIAVAECNPVKMVVRYPGKDEKSIASANCFITDEMKEYRTPSNIDSWHSELRFQTADDALRKHKDNYSLSFAKDLLAGKYGFICQYDRKKNADTVWSAIYDCKNMRFYRVEGNPSRKPFKEDKRLKY